MKFYWNTTYTLYNLWNFCKIFNIIFVAFFTILVNIIILAVATWPLLEIICPFTYMYFLYKLTFVLNLNKKTRQTKEIYWFKWRKNIIKIWQLYYHTKFTWGIFLSRFVKIILLVYILNFFVVKYIFLTLVYIIWYFSCF